MATEPNRVIGRYQLLAEIGAGGMGTVYRARDLEIEREVALKLLPPYFSSNPAFVQRFKREARVIARLEHPHIVPIYDVGEDEGRPYLIMRLLPGGTLRERLNAPGFDREALMKALSQIADALDAAHAQHIVHRDIKPSNILFGRRGSAFLSDFGIAKVLNSNTQLTGSAIIGTPAYMSPEQFSGGDIDGRTDEYSLAVVVFEALTGKLPFAGDTAQMMYKHLLESPPSVHELNTSLSPGFSFVLNRAMAKDPAERYPTVIEFVDALRNVQDSRPFATPDDAVLATQIDTPAPPVPESEPEMAVVPPVQTHAATASQAVPPTAVPVPPPPATEHTTPPPAEPSSDSRRALPLRTMAIAAGGLILLIALLGFGVPQLLGGNGSETPTEIPAVVDEVETPEATATIVSEPEPVAVTLDGDMDGARVRRSKTAQPEAVSAGDTLELEAGAALLSGDGPMRVMWPDKTVTLLDADTELELVGLPVDERSAPESVRLANGRFLFVPSSVDQSFVVMDADDTAVAVSGALVGIGLDDGLTVDCFAAACEMETETAVLDLSNGDAGHLDADGEPQPNGDAALSQYCGLDDDLLPCPTPTPTATATQTPTQTPSPTATATPFPTATSTPRPLPTFTPVPPTFTPVPDSDNDGVPDNQDNCPGESGPAENGGCPIPPDNGGDNGGGDNGGGSDGGGNDGGSNPPPTLAPISPTIASPGG